MHRLAVLMEHPPKQGLKLWSNFASTRSKICFNGTSTKTRIETLQLQFWSGLPLTSFNGTSTKTRIETTYRLQLQPLQNWF